MRAEETYNFKFWSNWADALKCLPEGQRGRYLEKMLDMVFYGEEPELEPIEQMLWSMMQNIIAADIASAGNSRGNGSKGGRPRKKTQGKTQQETQTKTQQKTHAKTQTKTQQETQTKTQQKTHAITQTETQPLYESETEGESEGETEREYDASARASFTAASLSIWNEVLGVSMLSFDSLTVMRLGDIMASGRTAEDVRKVVETARDQWEPRFITPGAVFRRFEDLLNRPNTVPKPTAADDPHAPDPDGEAW